MLKAIRSAIADIHAALALKRVWLALAAEDIGDQHKRTALGPFWLLINYLAFAGTFIFVFERGGQTPNYEAYVAIGLLVWFYIMEMISQSVTLFAREESFIKGTTLPLSVHVLRLLMQTLIRAGYASLGCMAILLFSGIALTAAWGWSILGIVLIIIISPAAIIVFAFLGAFFPDGQFIVQNLMRIGMFLTPVFWAYTGGGGIRAAFYFWNPFTYFLEIVRGPILSGAFPTFAFLLCAAIGLGVWLVGLMLLGLYRKRVVFVI